MEGPPLRAAGEGLLSAEELPDVIGNEAERPLAQAAGITRGEALITVVKTLLGAGVFSLPLVFAQAGIVASAVTTLAMAAVSTHTMCMLAQSERRVAAILEQPCVTFPVLVAHSLDGWVSPRVSGGAVRAIITLASVAVSAAYVALVTGTLSLELSLPHSAVLMCVGLVELALCQLRTFRLLSLTSGLGNLAITAGCAVVVAYGAMHAHGAPHSHGEPSRTLGLAAGARASGASGLSMLNGVLAGSGGSAPAPFALLVHWPALPRVLGPLSFNFAVHFTLLPVSQAMAEPRAFGAVVSRAFSLLAVLDCAFAAMCCALYGAGLRANVIDSMAPAAASGAGDSGSTDDRGGGSVAAVSAITVSVTKWLLAVSLLLTVPLIMAAARELVEEALLPPRALPLAAQAPGPSPSAMHGGSASSARDGSARGQQQGEEGALREADQARPLRRACCPSGALSTAVRAGLVGCVVLLVWCVPDFGALVTLAGGVAAAACGFVLPPLVNLRTHRMRLSRLSRASHVAISVFGVGIMVSSAYFAIADIVRRNGQ